MSKISVFFVLLAAGVLAVLFIVFTSHKTNTLASTDIPLAQNLVGTTTTATPSVTAPQGDVSSATQNTNNTNQQKIMSATLHTNKGDITIEFDPTVAPNAVASFIKLAGSGFYDGTKFHRVIKGFMDQGGDPLSKDDSQEARWGTGGPGYQFADEIGPTSKNNLGTVAMANSGPNTNGSQFFINTVNNNFLDGKYTVFGRVTAGMDVAEAINNVPTDSSDRPLNPVIITSITLNQS